MIRLAEVLAIWFGISIPVGIIAGRYLGGAREGGEDMTTTRLYGSNDQPPGWAIERAAEELHGGRREVPGQQWSNVLRHARKIANDDIREMERSSAK